MLGKISEKEARLQVSKSFPWCPFCCFENIKIDVQPERDHDFILCENCGAKWEMAIQEKVKSIKLTATSIDWKGKELLEKNLTSKFWRDKAWLCILTRKVPENHS
ncbi:MAG: hypothetical protein JSV05_09340 [Candidatus Bathyarchaeota archaeon]|nr:MAG: hypothetical protein JSV05_09340 [Candidatus Bathyarchaeota archaeon]